jgi:hypothetical protein
MANVAKMAKFDEKCGEKCAKMCAWVAEKCGWNVAGVTGISESDGRCFASETIDASK